MKKDLVTEPTTPEDQATIEKAKELFCKLQPTVNRDGNSMIEFYVPMRGRFELALPAPPGKVGIVFKSHPSTKQVKLLTTDPEEGKQGVFVQFPSVESKLDKWGSQEDEINGVIGYLVDQRGATPVRGDEPDEEVPF